ncbi:TPA: DUF551 domain-containing protein [Escherichia coli]|nr:DUF551 domain-containing protein [Escherichia coli]HDK2585779.1 DUF551 domain-containing protein [Escherichia coli]
MTVLTDKELIKEIKERIGSLDVRDNIERRAYEIALASLEAEPVGEFYEYKPGDWYQRSVGDKAPKWVPLYATPPVRELQADVAQAIENLKQKLVECNRYNYCADAVKGVEDASRVLALQNQNMSAPITPEAIENAIEYIRSIAFHINEDDYHGKHIAYFMRQALAWLEGHSCSNDRLGKADNQPVRGNQAAESNRGNEWTGNPDIDNAIIMLDRIDTLESCDDDRIEAVKAVLRRLAGNSPVTPDGWISCSERMPDTKTAVLVAVEFDRKGDWRMKWATYIPGHPDANDGWIIPGASWKPSHWMPLPEPPQEVNRG